MGQPGETGARPPRDGLGLARSLIRCGAGRSRCAGDGAGEPTLAASDAVGKVGRGRAAAASTLADLGYKAITAQNQIQQITDNLTLVGRSTSSTTDELTAMRGRIDETFHLGAAAAGELVSAFAQVPRISLESAEQLAGLAATIARVKNEDLSDTAQKMAAEAAKGGKAFLDWAETLGFQLDPRLKDAVAKLDEAGDKSQAVKVAISALSSIVGINAGAWVKATNAVEKFMGALGDMAKGMPELGAIDIGSLPNLPKTLPGAHPPVPEPRSREGTLQFGPSPSELAAAERDLNKASLVTLQTQVEITKERGKHLAALKALHAAEVAQGCEGPKEAQAKIAQAMAQFDAAAAKNHGGGAKGQASDLEKRQAEEKVRDAEQAVSAQQSIDESYLATFRAHMAEMVTTGKISKDQQIGFTIEYAAQLRDQLAQQLEAIKNNAAMGVDAQKRAWQELVEVGASYDAKIAELQAQAAEASKQSWKDATRELADAFATAASDIITRTKSIAQAFADLISSLIKDLANSAFKSLFNAILGGGPSGGSGGGGLLSGVFDSAFGSLFGSGISGLFGSLTAGLTGFGGGIGNFFSALGAGTLGMTPDAVMAAAMSGGGIAPRMIPSAAGGWQVPMLGPGGMLTQIHSNEMVLPSRISDFIQGAAASYAGGGGPSVSPVFNIQAMDAQSFAKWGQANAATFVAILNRALRHGSSLYPGAGG
jgi:hypothetical protein